MPSSSSPTRARGLARALGAACVAGSLALLPPGCASTQGEEAPASAAGALRPAGPLAAATSSENGLEVRRVVVRDEDERVGAALLDAGTPFAGLDAAGLERNGFLLIRIESARLDAVLAALGPPESPPLTQVSTWHGQAPNWREVLRRPARDPVAAVVDGRPRVFSDGSLRTQLRAWTVPMEDDAMLEVQLRQEFLPVDRGVRLMLDPAGDAGRGETLGPGVELLLAADEAWILTCRLPRDPVADDPDAPASEASAGKGPSPEDIFGPSASLPPTLGALLLSSETPATRTLLIFVPRLPAVATSDRPELDADSAAALDGPADPVGREVQAGQLGPQQGQPPAPSVPGASGTATTTTQPAQADEPRQRGFGGDS